jgi:NAD+ diphosphatase
MNFPRFLSRDPSPGPCPCPEPSTRTAFAGNKILRASENRPADCLGTALAHPQALAFGLHDGKLALAPGGDAGPLAPALLAKLSPLLSEAVLLGYGSDGAPRLALPVKQAPDPEANGFTAVPLRAVYAQGMLSGDDLGQLAQGTSLINWALATRFCGACGGTTRNEAGGYRRVCIQCGKQHFPRTDPVVIMLALDETRGRCLLGRSPHFPPGMYSCLAGFLEPGETMEDAVRRETLEEAGIAIGRVVYHASQPWPLPHTIMIGFYAEAQTFDIDRDATELEDCRWFSRAEAARLLERHEGEPTTAPDGAIANLLLRDWVDHTA